MRRRSSSAGGAFLVRGMRQKHLHQPAQVLVLASVPLRCCYPAPSVAMLPYAQRCNAPLCPALQCSPMPSIAVLPYAQHCGAPLCPALQCSPVHSIAMLPYTQRCNAPLCPALRCSPVLNVPSRRFSPVLSTAQQAGRP